MKLDRLVAGAANYLRVSDSYAFLRRIVTKSQIAILAYHRVSPSRDGYYGDMSVSPENFENQIRYLSQNFEVLSLGDLVNLVRLGAVPDKAAAVTFDDGYRDNYVHALPILKKYDIPATVFLATGHIGTGEVFWWDEVWYALCHSATERVDLEGVGSCPLTSEVNELREESITAIVETLKRIPDTRRSSLVEKVISKCKVQIPNDLGEQLMLSWREVEEMNCEGIAFGSHGVHHLLLTDIPLEQVRKEAIQSKNTIQEKLGKEVTAFSYPYGSFNAQVVETVKNAGFAYAVTAGVDKLISPKDDVHLLHRITPDDDFSKFKLMLCGLWGDLNASLGNRI